MSQWKSRGWQHEIVMYPYVPDKECISSAASWSSGETWSSWGAASASASWPTSASLSTPASAPRGWNWKTTDQRPAFPYVIKDEEQEDQRPRTEQQEDQVLPQISISTRSRTAKCQCHDEVPVLEVNANKLYNRMSAATRFSGMHPEVLKGIAEHDKLKCSQRQRTRQFYSLGNKTQSSAHIYAVNRVIYQRAVNKRLLIRERL